MTAEEFKDLASSFPGTISMPHFDRLAFKVEGKRIFATLHEKTASANIMLTVRKQQLFLNPVKGFTPFRINGVPKDGQLSKLKQ